jgi:hypothetical protein
MLFEIHKIFPVKIHHLLSPVELYFFPLRTG